MRPDKACQLGRAGREGRQRAVSSSRHCEGASPGRPLRRSGRSPRTLRRPREGPGAGARPRREQPRRSPGRGGSARPCSARARGGRAWAGRSRNPPRPDAWLPQQGRVRPEWTGSIPGGEPSPQSRGGASRQVACGNDCGRRGGESGESPSEKRSEAAAAGRSVRGRRRRTEPARRAARGGPAGVEAGAAQGRPGARRVQAEQNCSDGGRPRGPRRAPGGPRARPDRARADHPRRARRPQRWKGVGRGS